MQYGPSKKQKTKDSRLGTKYGSILTSASYIDTLNDLANWTQAKGNELVFFCSGGEEISENSNRKY